MFELLVSDAFQDGLKALPLTVRPRADRALERLAENYAHSSLDSHRIQSVPGKWECKFTKSGRIIFEPNGAEIRLWAIGDHTVIDRVQSRSFSPTTAFHRPASEPLSSGQQQFLLPEEWTARDEDITGPDGRPFRNLTSNQLRILGVPNTYVDAVRDARSPEELEALPLARSETAAWLLE